MKLVADWKTCPKWWSVRFLTLAIACETIQQIVPQWLFIIPEPIQPFITPTLTTLALLSRLVHQELGNADKP